VLGPFLHEIIHIERNSLSPFYLRHFKHLDILVCAVLLKVHSGGLDRILRVAPLLLSDRSPSVTDGLLCEGYVLPLGLRENFRPELSTFIQFH